MALFERQRKRNSTTTPLPRFSLAEIEPRYNALQANLRNALAGVVLQNQFLQNAIDACAASLPASISRATLEKTLAPYLGRHCDNVWLIWLARRLAGNLALLRQGVPVPIYGPASFLGWSVFKIRGVTRQSDRLKRPGALIRVKAIAGSLCPEEGECWLSVVQCRHQVAPGLGYSRPRSSRSRHPAKYPWLVPEQLMGHWFLGRAEAKRDAPFWITDMETSSAVRSRNRGLVRHRYRIDPGFKCPMGYPNTHPCHKCPVGSLRCPSATHQRDYVDGECSVCAKPSAWVDPDHPEMCVECYLRRQR